MLSNYFKVALRNLLKNRVFSFINISGLAFGLTCFLLIVHYVRFERSYESFHKNADNIVRVTLDLYKGSEYVVTDCETYAPFGSIVKEKMPEVVDFVRMMDNSNLEVKVGERKFFEGRIYFADPSVFNIFSYSIIQGDSKQPLSNPHQVVITSSMAKKYFGNLNAVGQSMEIGGNLYKLTAVMADVPPNTHLKFDFLLSHSTLPKLRSNYRDDNWQTGNNEYTYLLMAPKTDLTLFNKKLADLSNSLKDKMGSDRFVAQPINDIHLYSNKSFEPEVNGNARTVYFLLIIAIFILVLAWVNYINLATARAVERAQEVGIRKVMGSFRSQLILQFFSESLVINFLAAAVVIVFVRIGLPFFRELSGVPLPLGIFGESIFWYSLLGLILVGSLLSGLYPAVVLSSFKPSSVLKGKFRSSAHGQWMRKGLVVFQFAATAVLVICLGTVYLQIEYLRNYDLGMKVDQTLVIRLTEVNQTDSVQSARLNSLKNELLKHSAIRRITGSGSIPGADMNELSTTNSIFRVGHEQKEGSYNYYHYSIDGEFVQAFNMKLAAGRNFESGMSNVGQVIVNEESVRALGFASNEEAIGAKINYWAGGVSPSSIIGVIKNFNQRSPKEKPIPMIFPYSQFVNFLSLNIQTNNVQETVGQIKSTWEEALPGNTFIYFFLDEKYNQQYNADTQFGAVIGTFSILALLIACMGLFGLSSYTILQRTKEIGIRKVLGGSVGQIVSLLSLDFIKLVLIAGVIAIPFAYFIMEGWLSNYAARIDISLWVFVLPVITILIISVLTVSFQTIKAAQTNPVDTLRNE